MLGEDTKMKLETDIYVDGIESEKTIFHHQTENALTYERAIRYMQLAEHLKYPFVDGLKMNVDDAVELPLDSRVEMCIYRINYGHHNIPFLEFLLYSEGNKKDKNGIQLVFPYILSKHTKGGLIDQCSVPLRALFNDEKMIRYNGYVYNKRDKRCVLFFNQLHNDESVENRIPFVSSKKRWWWTLSSEIFNEHRMMNYPISVAVVEFFNMYPEIMNLKSSGKTLETPIACYAGKHFNYVSYMASFGMKKASTRAHFGPYYYFVGFMDAMMHACYSIRAPHMEKTMGKHKKHTQFNPHILADGTSLTVNEYGKHTRGGIVRFAVFLGRCRAFFMNGEEDRSELSMYWAKQDPIIMAKLALRDINGDWTRYFNSAYVGEYDFDAPDERKSKRSAGWTIKDYENQIPLSCHEIDMANVPDEYEADFTNYVIL
jgi:hypothetical protein